MGTTALSTSLARLCILLGASAGRWGRVVLAGHSSTTLMQAVSRWVPEHQRIGRVFTSRVDCPGGPDVMTRGDYLVAVFTINKANTKFDVKILRRFLSSKTESEHVGVE